MSILADVLAWIFAEILVVSLGEILLVPLTLGRRKAFAAERKRWPVESVAVGLLAWLGIAWVAWYVKL